MNTIRVRAAAKEDAGLIARLSRDTFYETFAPHNSKADMEKFMSEQFSFEALKAEVGAPGQYFFLALDGTKPAGYAKMREGERFPEFGDRASIEIARIYAVSDYIGRGAGATLMRHCLSAAGSMGKELVWLGVWEKNEKAIGFYQKWGFQKFGEHIFLLGDDPQTDWLMMKALNGS